MTKLFSIIAVAIIATTVVSCGPSAEEKAKAMAARAHQIFLEKFTVERDLVRIAKMHEYILNQEKEMGLRYPLAY